MRLLARREHAAYELAAKLEQRGFERGAAEAEIQRLGDEGLQSDERFAELFVEQRVGRGDGPLKIRASLAERGVASSLVDASLAPYEQEWTALARDALERRFGARGASTRAERAKRMRFLQQRGFPADAVWRVTDEDNAEE
ncbi:MAG TPA: regulatory protein RecX [Gammaproteobacteria bacterium]|nr:regulatory protein RecX [Gammaproteobacteria bacterium]